MDDPRFEQGNWPSIKYAEEKRQRLHEYANRLPDLGSLRAALEGWWTESILSRHADPQGAEPRAALNSVLFKLGDPRLAGVVSAIVDELASKETSESLPTQLARVVLAESLGRALALEPPSADAFATASRLAHEVLDEWTRFRSSFLEVVSDDAGRRTSWIAVLGQLPTSIDQYLRLAADEAGIIQALVRDEEEYRKAPEPSVALARHGGFVRLNDALRVRLVVLLALNVGEWVQTLERIPCGYIAHEIISFSGIHRDRQLLLEALRECPPIIENGAVTGNRILYMILDATRDHAQALEESVRRPAHFGDETPTSGTELDRLRNDELPGWFRTALSALLDRPDGISAALEYSVVLVNRSESARDADWTANGCALDVLISMLAKRGVGLADARRISERSKRLSPVSFLLTGCALELGSKEGDDAWAMRDENIRSNAWDWYVDLLEKGDDGIIGQVNPYSSVSWPFHALGAVLAGSPDMARRWLETWERLFEQRRASRFRYGDRTLEPSLHLARVGCGALDVLLPLPETKRSSAGLLWEKVTRSLRFLVKGQAGRMLPLGEVFFSRMFAYLPHVFGAESWRHLEDWWPTLETDERTMLRAVAAFLANAPETQGISRVLRNHGFDFDCVSARAHLAEKIDPTPECHPTVEEVCAALPGLLK